MTEDKVPPPERPTAVDISKRLNAEDRGAATEHGDTVMNEIRDRVAEDVDTEVIKEVVDGITEAIEASKEEPDDQGAEVITHAKFGGAERAKQLKEAGVIVDLKIDDQTEKDLNLPAPAYKEMTIGKLEPAEIEMYVAYHNAMQDSEKKNRFIFSLILHKMGDAVGSSDMSKSLETVMMDHPELVDSIPEEDAIGYFKARRRADALRGMFFWQLAQRMDCYDHILGVRTKWRIVRTKRSW